MPLFARAALRLHWRALVGLALLVGIAIAAVVASASAAGRAEGVFRALRSKTQATDVTVTADAGDLVDQVAAVAAQPGVRRVAARAELFVRPAGHDELYPDYNVYPWASLRARDTRRVDVPVIVKGRAVDPRRADEVTLSEKLAEILGLTVGDPLPLESMTDAWVDVAYNGGDPGPPDGPTVKTRVVGIERTPADFGRWLGVIHLGPAFVHRYGGDMRTYRAVDAQVPRSTDRSRLVSNAGGGIEVGPSVFADADATDDGLNTIATALRVLAAVAALAGGVVVALDLVRLTRLTLSDRSTLVALGWTRHQMALAAVLVIGPWAGLGAVVGAGLGVVIAPRALVGLAGRVDPTLGAIWLEGRVVLAAVATVALLGLAVIAVAARRPATAAGLGRHLPPRILRLDRPLAVVLGVRHAVAGTARLGGRTSRTAIVVMAVALAGAIAAFTVSASIGRLQTDPLLTGQGAGRLVDSGESVEVYDRVLPLLERDRRVSSLAGIEVVSGVTVDGHRVTTLAYDPVRGGSDTAVVAGRVPRGRDEVALGPATLDAIGHSVGDRVRLRGPEGTARYRIVGSTLFPEGDFSYDSGLLLTIDAAASVAGRVHDLPGGIHQVLFDWARGVDVAAAERDLRRAGFTVQVNENALKPAPVTNLAQVEALPRYLALLLGLLGLATFAHAAAVSSRRRVHEAATLRALGLAPSDGAAVVGIQALTILGIAVVVGVPLGVLLGHRIWAPIAENANVVVATVVPTATVAAFVVALVVAAAAVIARPAWRTYRLKPTDALRVD